MQTRIVYHVYILHIVTNNEPISDFDEFKNAENKPIFNSKIKEIEGIIKNAKPDENVILPIASDKIITHPAIKEMIDSNNLLGQI